jgi:four helix bundle protein
LGRHIAGQLVRSGTSPAPNYEEGCASESRQDFIHKLSICLKELRESRSWLRLILKAELLPEKKIADLLNECNQLCNIIAQSVVTAKGNGKSSERHVQKFGCRFDFTLRDTIYAALAKSSCL